ncbi:Indoleamine 2,3-dioxygenase-domain-containing protein [Mycena sp. CBHHK59/15]|nr:Indoleamine 2,3-dioxygenase-domain-containing protein [Mycena sp. CBHHK59/15]
MGEPFVGEGLALCRVTSFLDRLAHIIDDLTALLATVCNGCNPTAFYSTIRPWFRDADSDPAWRPWMFAGLAQDDYPVRAHPTELSGASAYARRVPRRRRVLACAGLTSHAATGQKTSAFLARVQLYMPRHHRNFLTHLAADPRPLHVLVMGAADAEPRLLGAYNARGGCPKAVPRLPYHDRDVVCHPACAAREGEGSEKRGAAEGHRWDGVLRSSSRTSGTARRRLL